MKKLITEADINLMAKSGITIFYVEKGIILTPLAIDQAKRFNIKIEYGNPPAKNASLTKIDTPLQFLKIAVGSDHTGYKMKQELIPFLKEQGVLIIDVGCDSEASCDYPDFAIAVAQKVIKKEVDGGIVFDATGIPSAITANKIKGIRCATCYNEFSALSARSHNNSNVIALGARTFGIETIKSILKVWLKTPFEGGRHQKRLDKITALER
jgi:ribose 5-phosphate isomerase B